MNIDYLYDLFAWMTGINIVFLVISFVLITLKRKTICSLHGKIFGIKEEKVTLSIYNMLGIYKILIFVFNITPLLALYFIYR
jgi:hypothetical protein